MRTFYLTLILFICGYTAEAADNLRVFSQPEIPSQEVLDRLNLKMMWRAFSPMEGKRDGYHDIQISENQVIAQTRSGTVIVFNSETGEVVWKSHFGKPYQVFYNIAFNDKFVFAVNENDLYALDRRNGNIVWQSSFGISISAPPTVDKHHLYLSGSKLLMSPITMLKLML
ncbi:MAG: PQQ-binding-like beta-propeller repeat protein [Planctomycetota bacterium]|nr:PQQ-binding-like beta-propeller repeat protein [Planctomycetota bacterium]